MLTAIHTCDEFIDEPELAAGERAFFDYLVNQSTAPSDATAAPQRTTKGSAGWDGQDVRRQHRAAAVEHANE